MIDVQDLGCLTEKAEQGDVDVQFYIGYEYYLGRRMKQDLVKAVYWIEKAAQQGFQCAQYVLACLYYNGEGVAQDEEQAVSWFMKSAQQGSMKAVDVLIKLGYHADIPKDIFDLYVKKQKILEECRAKKEFI